MSNELYLKYAEVIEMCRGTKLEATPWVCVKYLDGTIKDHPLFRNTNERDFKFALAIVEDKPVFIGDVLYNDIFETKYIVEGTSTCGLRLKGVYSGAYYEGNPKLLTWKIPKKIFKLGEYEFPCPKEVSEFWSLPLKTFDRYFIIDDNNAFLFDTEEDAKLVKDTLIKIFRENLK